MRVQPPISSAVNHKIKCNYKNDIIVSYKGQTCLRTVGRLRLDALLNRVVTNYQITFYLLVAFDVLYVQHFIFVCSNFL